MTVHTFLPARSIFGVRAVQPVANCNGVSQAANRSSDRMVLVAQRAARRMQHQVVNAVTQNSTQIRVASTSGTAS
jgi:hypothetical protein